MPLLPYNIIPTRAERIYLQPEVTFGTFVVATDDSACRLIRCTMTPSFPMLIRADKTGTLSQTVGIPGRIYGTYEVEMSLVGNGVAGVQPDAFVLLEAAFGQAGVVVADTSVTYSLSDASYAFDLWSYRNINGAAGADLEQRLAGGSVVTTLEISFGQDFAILTARGDSMLILSSVYFSSASTVEKGGLTSFAVEPSAPVTNGYPAAGFVGLITIDGDQVFEIKTGTIVINTGRRLIRDTFGSFLPTGIEAAERVVTIALVTDDSDSATQAALKVVSESKAPITYSIQLGNVAGNIFTFTGANLVLNPPVLQDQQIRYQARWPEARCFSSTYTARDEITLVAT